MTRKKRKRKKLNGTENHKKIFSLTCLIMCVYGVLLKFVIDVLSAVAFTIITINTSSVAFISYDFVYSICIRIVSIVDAKDFRTSDSHFG